MNFPMNLKNIRIAIFLIATHALCTCAIAQNDQKIAPKPAEAACIPAKNMKAEQLFGLWSARFTNPPEGMPASATILLERHAEFSESLAGIVSRDFGAASGSPKIAGHAPKAFLAGDLEDGLLLLDESSDNISITGTWNGEMVAESCGKVFKGSWKDTSKTAPDNAPDIPFTLTRLSQGW